MFDSFIPLRLLLQPSAEDAASRKAALHQARGVVRNVCLILSYRNGGMQMHDSGVNG